jgi:hypothetical protein
VLELILGYHGFGRLIGDEPGSIGGLPGSGGRAVGGGQIARLLPAALPPLATRALPREALRA